ncbi:MAG: hypothetical protein MK132_10425 [Lentisphaerales bacterium]|nr:hypothetical protein [Lentisphaerales bacterium]
MTLAGKEIENDLSKVSEETLKREFHRLKTLGLHKVALSIDAAIAEKD